MYLLDTNIVIFLFKGRFQLDEKIDSVGNDNCFISEISLAELLYGAEKSNRSEYHHNLIATFLQKIQVLPIFGTLDIYAKEKARLEKAGTRLDDFDLLIGATAIGNDLTLVTNNTAHFQRMDNIKLEDWTKISK